KSTSNRSCRKGTPCFNAFCKTANTKRRKGCEVSMSKIFIFDTTLRDGEQSPGVDLNQLEKMEIAKQLERYGVDRMEVGFPASSKGDFNAVKNIADTIQDSSVTGLARAVKSDI